MMVRATLRRFAPPVALKLRARWARLTAVRRHARLHRNPLFYTLTPELLIAIQRSFARLQNVAANGGPNLLKGHAYYEFGLFKGFSLWYADQIAAGSCDMGFRCYGFDSFSGLPQTQVDSWNAFWKKGTYAASRTSVENLLRTHGADFSRVRLFEGFFSDELFSAIASRTVLRPAAIVVIDSDVYESCVPVLRFIRGYLRPGTIILFDEFRLSAGGTLDSTRGEARAFAEFRETYPEPRFRHIFDYGRFGTAFEVESARGSSVP